MASAQFHPFLGTEKGTLTEKKNDRNKEEVEEIKGCRAGNVENAAVKGETQEKRELSKCNQP